MSDEISAKGSTRTPGDGPLSPLRGATLVILLAGAAGCVALVLIAGNRNPSQILRALFALWVLSPFVAMAWAYRASARWSVLTQNALCGLMLVLTVGSWATYGVVALGPPRAKTAFVFVVVPPASWLLIAIALSLAALISRRLSSRDHAA